MHSTLVIVKDKGVLLQGKSGSGKSDLALRLIERYGAELVSDDVVRIIKKNGRVYGSAPQNIAGLLEVRGIGIISYPYQESSAIELAVNLKDNADNIERLPSVCKEVIFGLEIPQIDLYAKEDSAPEKILAALKMLDIRSQIEDRNKDVR